jgi:RTX calcium-binding nonapeptide repeat (4 copies)
VAIIVQSTNYVSNGAYIPFGNDGDTWVLFSGVTFLNPNATGLRNYDPLTGNYRYGNLNIFGNVIGATIGIDLGGTGVNYVTIADTGHVQGNAGNEGLRMSGTHYVTNYGQIDCTGSNGWGVQSDGSGNIFNAGSISASAVGVYNFDYVISDVVSLENIGTIKGSNYSYIGGDSIDQITNSGTMSGNIFTGGGNDKLLNFGHVYGNIDMGDGNDTVYTHLSELSGYTLAGGNGSDSLVNLDTSGVAAINLDAMGFENYAGKDGADYVWAGSAAASLSFNGGAGNDAFVGGTSSDYVAGGLGADYLDGGAGFNTVVYSGSLTGVTVNLFNNTVSGGDGAGDTILNFQAIVGSDNSDNLYGNNGVNYISGAGGNDVIAGFGGNDNLTGGAGNDIFYYGSAGFGNDEITDFSIGQDQAYISSALASSFAALNIVQSGINTVVTFAGGSLLLDNTTATNLHASDFVFF